MMRVSAAVRLAAVAALFAALGACGLNEKIDEAGKIDYRSSARLPSLEIPPDLTKPRADERFSVPESAGDQRTWSSFERSRSGPAVPVASRVLPQADDAHIERDGESRWLVVNRPPEQVWPVVRDFWQESGFGIETESPKTGIIETDWAENRAKLPLDFIRKTIGRVLDSLYSTGERDKFRTRLERTPDGGTAVYITHRGMVEVYTSTAEERTVWQPRPSDTELEAEFLRRLMLRFVPEDGAPQTAQAGAADRGGDSRASLVNTATAQHLEIAEDFDRAWRLVGLALDRGGFTVEDRDRSRGVYYVRYIDPEIEGGRSGKKPGFFSRMFGSKPRADASPRFRVEVQGENDRTVVQVRDGEGHEVAEVDRKTAARILALLQEQMKG